MGRCQICNNSFGILGGGSEPFTGSNLILCNRCGEILKQIDKLKCSDISKCESMGTHIISMSHDENITGILVEYIENITEEGKRINELKIASREKKQKENDVKKELYTYKKDFTATTGYNFEGYRIVEYKGIVSGDAVIGTGFINEFSASISDLLGVQSNAFSNKMNEVKEIALDNLVQNALIEGGNAVIGVDFDYITFNNNMLGISVNGTSVTIERCDSI